MSNRKEIIVMRSHLIEIVKQFQSDWFDPSDMFILIDNHEYRPNTMNTY